MVKKTFHNEENLKKLYKELDSKDIKYNKE